MQNILNITNGDCAVDIMKQAKLPGTFLPWRDVLHEGPVPQNLSLEELSKVRAQYLASLNWDEFDNIHQNFIARDNTLKSFENYSKVILWFEHDLYDQLQILQLLDWFAEHPSTSTPIYIICTEQYLGLTTPEQMTNLLIHIKPVTPTQLLLAQKAWTAFRSPTPEKWFQLLSEDTSQLEFLNAAVLRMLEEYPSKANGLSRTANTALAIINEGEIKPGKLFGRYIQTEERVFLGDASFWIILNQFLDSQPALIKINTGDSITLPAQADQVISITPMGIEILNAKKNFSSVLKINRWIGGVELNAKNKWLWNIQTQQLETESI